MADQKEVRTRLTETFTHYPKIASDVIEVIAEFRGNIENQLMLPLLDNSIEAGIKLLRLNTALQQMMSLEETFRAMIKE